MSIKEIIIGIPGKKDGKDKKPVRNEDFACLSSGNEKHISFLDILLYHTNSMIA